MLSRIDRSNSAILNNTVSREVSTEKRRRACKGSVLNVDTDAVGNGTNLPRHHTRTVTDPNGAVIPTRL
jgi:hypothetical protein